MNSLFPISSSSVIYRELAACAPILEKFGMALSPAETAALAEQQSAALRSSGRIDLSGGAVKQLALIFCDSPIFSAQTGRICWRSFSPCSMR